MQTALVTLLDGNFAAPLAADFWASLDEKSARSVLFEFPWELRPELLEKVWRKSAKVGIARGAAAWIVEMGDRSKTGSVHFAMDRNLPDALRFRIGAEFLRLAAARFETLIALVPVPFRGARALIGRLGFRSLAILPKSCRVYLHERSCDGILYLRNLE